MQPWIRVGDADRRRVVDALQRHTAEGRLSLDEFSARAGAAFGAVTHADLAAVTAGLPTVPPAGSGWAGPASRSLPGRVGRGMAAATLAVAAFLTVLAGGAAPAASSTGWFDMGDMMASVGAVMGCR